MSFYLIDFENVGEAGFNGIENLQKEDMIIVFYSKNTNTSMQWFISTKMKGKKT